MAEIRFQNVSRCFSGGRNAVKDFSLEIEDGEFITIAGPANSGKATILRMIAGTESISEGELSVNGESIPVGKLKKRNVGMIFQNYTLYPGMTVRENLAFSMKLQGETPEKIEALVQKTAELFNIENLLSCYPREMNELQKQYVAMARAYVHEPMALLILDSLQRLSPGERTKARKRLLEIYNQIKMTIVYVTDSGNEVTKLNKRTVIMRGGVIEQVGTVKELQEKPRNLFVAQFMFEPGFCTSMVTINKTPSTMEAITKDFGVDVPKEWAAALEEKGFVGKEVLMGYTVRQLPDEEETIAPEGDCKLFFFEPKTGKAINY